MGFYSKLKNAGFTRDAEGRFVGDPNNLPPELLDDPAIDSGNVVFNQPLRDRAAEQSAEKANRPLLDPSNPTDRARALASMGLGPPVPPVSPHDGQSDGTHPPRPYDPLDPSAIDDVARSIADAAAQTQTPSDKDRLFRLEKMLEILLKQHGDIWPPMPRGTGDDSSSGGLEFVVCTSDGGANGDESTKATWTYTVVGATVSGTGVSPLNPRRIGLTEEPAGPWYGLARTNDAGEVDLFLVEPIDAGACPDGEDITITGGF